MKSKKLEYDSSLGGPVELEAHLSTYKYVAPALNEMIQLVKTIKQCNNGKTLIFQTVPKRMRRRAMSHHPNRLPRKYRAAHIVQMSKCGKPHKKKRPTRKYRRRPKNLLNAYLGRQRKVKWLETHIWHAKRFHMVQRWGYRLPYANCDKTYRACYRATTQHCLLQDVSFYACIELSGPLEELKHGFHRLTNQSCSLSVTAKTFITGKREGCVDFFKAGQYPYKALGKVSFIWCPSEVDDVIKTLWLWIHPCTYQTILEELVTVFDLKTTKVSKILINGDKDEEPSTYSGKVKSRLKFMTKIITRQNVPMYKNTEGSILLKELKDTMNRFRLTGPKSQSILNQAFKVKDISKYKKVENEEQWLQICMQNDSAFIETHNKQKKFWEWCQNNVATTSNLLSNMVLALTIEDPRLHRPNKRTNVDVNPSEQLDNKNFQDILSEPLARLSYSPLWHKLIRDLVSNKMLSTHNYCKLREERAIVPGESCYFEDSIQPVPVLLIQRPGTQQADYKRLSYGCGWDIISPAGYGMAIWLNLIMWGARPGGLREFETLSREMGTDEHLPDTVGGKQMAFMRYEELRNKYFRLPPNKRCNYQKLSIISPFRVPFESLVRDWKLHTNEYFSKKLEEFYVLRDRIKLQDIIDCLKKSNLKTFPCNLPSGCLIQLKFTLKNRGSPSDYSLICLPSKRDFKRQLKNALTHQNEPIFTEPLTQDPNEKERKKLRNEHQKLLKRLRRRRVKEKRKLQETSDTKVFIRPAATSLICKQQFKQMCSLWLPEDCSSLFVVRKQGCRETIGYLTCGQFCLTEGVAGGIGYVTLEGLKELIQLNQQYRQKQPVCLVRSVNSRHYRFAIFKINLEV